MAITNPFNPGAPGTTDGSGNLDPFKAVQDAIDAAYEQITGMFTGFIDGITSGVQNMFNGIGEFFNGLWNGIGDFFSGLGREVQNFFGGIVSGISDALNGVWNGLGSAFNNARNGIVDFFGGIGRWFGDLGNGIGNFFGGLWNGMLDAARGWYQWLAHVISDIAGVWLKGFWDIYSENWYWTIPATIVGAVVIWYVFFRNTRTYPTQFDRQMDSNIRMQDHYMKQKEAASKVITKGLK